MRLGVGRGRMRSHSTRWRQGSRPLQRLRRPNWLCPSCLKTLSHYMTASWLADIGSSHCDSRSSHS
eukprot:4506577-Pyramimonas_sp.AAC.1